MGPRLRASWVAATVGGAVLAACAAVSGVDALVVCSGKACDGGASGASGSSSGAGDGASSGSSGASGSGGTSGASGVVTLPCGPGLTCAGGRICCIGADGGPNTCAGTCGTGNLPVGCELPKDCPGQTCCVTRTAAGVTQAACVAECPDPGGLRVCDPAAPGTCGADQCAGRFDAGGGVGVAYCN